MTVCVTGSGCTDKTSPHEHFSLSLASLSHERHFSKSVAIVALGPTSSSFETVFLYALFKKKESHPNIMSLLSNRDFSSCCSTTPTLISPTATLTGSSIPIRATPLLGGQSGSMADTTQNTQVECFACHLLGVSSQSLGWSFKPRRARTYFHTTSWIFTSSARGVHVDVDVDLPSQTLAQ